jgi:hypothetical protein
MILWAIVLIDEQGLNMTESLTITLPPSVQRVRHKVTGHFWGCQIQKHFIKLWQDNSVGRDGIL